MCDNQKASSNITTTFYKTPMKLRDQEKKPSHKSKVNNKQEKIVNFSDLNFIPKKGSNNFFTKCFCNQNQLFPLTTNDR